MFKNIKKNENKSTSQKFLIILFCLIFIICPYLTVWFLVGEFNTLKLNWFHFLDNNIYIFNLNILYIFIGIIFFSFLMFFVFCFFLKLLKIDAIPFIIMSNVIGITTIVTGLIPYDAKSFYYIIIARFFIILVATLFFFFVSNLIINKIMLSSRNQYEIYRSFKNEENEHKKMSDDFNELIKKKKEKDYIEIERE